MFLCFSTSPVRLFVPAPSLRHLGIPLLRRIPVLLLLDPHCRTTRLSCAGCPSGAVPKSMTSWEATSLIPCFLAWCESPARSDSANFHRHRRGNTTPTSGAYPVGSQEKRFGAESRCITCHASEPLLPHDRSVPPFDECWRDTRHSTDHRHLSATAQQPPQRPNLVK